MVLQEQSLVDIEMPGQYMNGDEPSPDGIVFLEGISSNVHVGFARRACASMLAVMFRSCCDRTKVILGRSYKHDARPSSPDLSYAVPVISLMALVRSKNHMSGNTHDQAGCVTGGPAALQ